MKTKTGLCITLCGSMLMGCSSLSDSSLAFWKTPPKMAMTADGEYQRGRQFHLIGQYSDAQKAYLSALAIDPQHAEARNALAALIGASGDLDRAIGMLVELSQRHPQSHVFANLGHAYQMRGQLFEARNAYQRAVDIDPGNENARRKLAALEQQLGATAVVEATPIPEPVAAQPAPGAIDLVMNGVYAMRYPVGTVDVPEAASVDLLKAPAETTPRASVPGRIDVTEAASVDLLNAPAEVPPKMSVPMAVAITAIPAESRKSDAIRPPTRSLTVELVNGNGVTGLARQLRGLLPANEWKVVRTANHADFWVRQTRIEYVEPHKPAARRLAEEIGVRPALRPNNEMTGTRLRVVLGHDFKDLESLRQRLAAGEAQPAS